MPSFDVISKINYQEFDNALSNCLREIGNRYDFKGLTITIERKDKNITTIAPDELKLKQVNELLGDKSLSKAKVLEEIEELVEALEKDTNKIHEAADVFYHLIMYMEAYDLKIEDVMAELEKRKK